MITAYLINSEKSLAALYIDLRDVAGPFTKCVKSLKKIEVDGMSLARIELKTSVIIHEKEIKPYDTVIRYCGPLEYLSCFGEPEFTFIVDSVDPFEGGVK